MYRTIYQLLGSFIYSSMVFWSMYFDFFHRNAWLHLITLILPVLYVRQYRYLVLSIGLSCIVSLVLVNRYIPNAETYFKPFDKSTFVIFESVLFGVIQGLIIMGTKKIIQYNLSIRANR